MTFQKIILIIAAILLIIALIIFGVSIYNQKYSSVFPPVVAECPDYWESIPGDKNNTSNCLNIKNLGSSNCSKTMNFNVPEFSGSNGLCNKKKWAQNCNLTWDGVTNSSKQCN